MVKTYFIILLFLLQSVTYAQGIVTVMTMPKTYFGNPNGDFVESKARDEKTNFYWVVYSDRDDNKVYDEPNGRVINSVNFLDRFFVTNESAGYLELYNWAEKIIIEKNQLNPNKAVKVGWIKKEFLLLWTRRCLQNKVTNFTEKAMAVTKAETWEDNIKLDNSLHIFNDPSLTIQNNNTVKMFNFLFVYKMEGNKVLIGKNYKSTVYSAKKDILGWVDKKFLQLWPDRVCLAPNTDINAVTSRKNAGVIASLFEKKEDAIAWKNGIGKPEPTWNKDTYEKPWIGSQQRFPIFELGKDNDIIYTGFGTDLFKEGTDISLIGREDLAIARKAANEIVKQIRNINIIFVIDAGGGMMPYANAIKNSLDQLIINRRERVVDGDKRNLYKYGAVIYRSEEDKNCPNGKDLSLNEISLTTSGSDVISFLDREFKNEGCSNEELKKDVNGALIEALNMIKEANKGENIQSNCIFFLGGATGNTGPASPGITDLIAKYNVNLSVFQVHNAYDPVEFEDFPGQFRKIIFDASSKLAALKKLEYKTEPRWKPILQQQGDQNLYQLDYPLTCPLKGDIYFPNRGKIINSKDIDNILDLTIRKFEDTLENSISTFLGTVIGIGQNVNTGKKSDVLNATVKNYLERLGKNMDNYSLAKNFDGKNIQFFIPAYTSLNVNKVDNPIFKISIYVHETELTEMIEKFEMLQFETNPTETRINLKAAFQTLIDAYIGKDAGIDFIKKVNIAYILEKITGLPTKATILKNIRISDIEDVGKVTDNEIEEVVKRIRQSYDQLRTVTLDTDNTKRDRTDDGVYYYIPQDYFP